jgi:hypothetical protein
MMKVYQETGPYWNHHIRKLVDDEYKTIAGPSWSACKRTDGYHTDTTASLADWRGYLTTWSGFQTMRKAVGDQAAEKLLNDFEAECRKKQTPPKYFYNYGQNFG